MLLLKQNSYKMRSIYLLFITIVIQPTCISSICTIRHIVRGIPGYSCDSNSDLLPNSTPTNISDLRISTTNLQGVLNDSSFSNFLNLRYLEIDSSVGILKPKTFASLIVLEHLILHLNYLPRIYKGIFENLPVVYLSLDGNDIRTIEENAFENMTRLETLRLVNNSLYSVDYGVFNGLYIETLALSKNKITHVADRAFYDMRRLKRLHLDGNNLQKFEPCILMNYHSKLEILWLHNNVLTEIDRKLVKGLTKLRVLNLSFNKIKKIYIYTFERLKYLETLLLSGNELENLEADIFPPAGMPRLIQLYMDNNRLTYLRTNILARLNGVKKIHLFGNPWQCPCLDIIFRWLSDNKISSQCKSGYSNGTKPICVIHDVSPKICNYVNEPFYYNKFKEAIDEFPEHPFCIF